MVDPLAGVDPVLLRWEAEQVVRMHDEAKPLVDVSEHGRRVLVSVRATGRCARCADDGCDRYEWAREVLDAYTTTGAAHVSESQMLTVMP